MNNKFLLYLTFITIFFISPAFSYPLDTNSFSNIIQNSISGVVSIKAFTKTISDSNNESYFTSSNKITSQEEPSSLEDSISLGTGFIIKIDTKIYILTAYHVVHSYNYINVIFYNGTRYPSKLYKYDSSLDLAVLVLDYSKDKKEKLGNIKVLNIEDGSISNQIKPGDFILSIGNQNGFINTANMGIISFIGRKIKNYTNLIQLDIRMDPGNSGSPIFDLNSKVIGMSVGINNSNSFAIHGKTINTFLSRIKF